MTIAEKEDRLFEEWGALHARFVPDGVVDEAAYEASKRKLLFVLKEVNDTRTGADWKPWDLRAFLREGARAQTWDVVARWIEGVGSLERDLPWSDLKSLDKIRRQEALRGVAVMNLKKVPGADVADPSEVERVARADAAFLRRQAALYGPLVTICCGTATVFNEAMAFRDIRWRSTSRGTWFHEPEPGRFVVEFSHPGARCAPQYLHYALMDALREILGIKPA